MSIEMPMDEQMSLNIMKNRLDKKVYMAENAAEERKRKLGKDKSKLNAFMERIKKRAQDMEKTFFPK
jgi:hypothetical protein